MEQLKEILPQEPHAEPVEVNDLSEVGGYIVYISLNYLDKLFESMGIQNDHDEQNKLIEEMQQGISNALSSHNACKIYSWMWHQADGTESCAVKVVPVAAKLKGVTIVTPDVTAYKELKDIIEKQQRTIEKLQCDIKNCMKMRQKAVISKT